MGSTESSGHMDTVLSDDAVDALERMAAERHTDWSEIIGLIRSMIGDGIGKGSFSESDALSDMYVVLSIARACRLDSGYDSFQLSRRFLEPLESSAGSCGEWYGRYAEALLFSGRPVLAREYLERGVSADPGNRELWCSLSRVRHYLGDGPGAMAALAALREIDPGSEVADRLESAIGSGMPAEELELIDSVGYGGGMLCDRADHDFDRDSRAKAATGIICDRGNLEDVKASLGTYGWMPDHPYCTSMFDFRQSTVMVTFEMDEASVSKLDPARTRYIMSVLESLDRDAREHLASRMEDPSVPLAALEVHPDLSVTMRYASGSVDGGLSVSFDSDMELEADMSGGPFGAMILLKGDGYDPKAVVDLMSEVWGIRLAGTEIDGGSVTAAFGNNLFLMRLVDCPVPRSEIGPAADANYLWPESAASLDHRTHLIVAVVNHGGLARDGCMDLLKAVDSCVRCTDCAGVYMNEVVYRPGHVTEAMDAYRDSGNLPLQLMVWVSLFGGMNGSSAGTTGLSVLARNEIDAVNIPGTPEHLLEMMYGVISLEVSDNYMLRAGDAFEYEGMTVTVSEGDGSRLRLDCGRQRP